MTLDDLDIFIAVCQAENLSAVARDLGCTQPAVSQHITRLENELGTPLLERRARGVSVTPAGRLFYEHVVEGLGTLKLGVRQVRQLQAGEAGALGITTGSTTIRHFMTDVVSAFRERYPQVQLQFHSANSHRRCIDALRNEQADLAFVTMGTPIRGLEQRPVVEMPWVLVTPQSAAWSEKDTVALQDLKRIPYIRLKESSTSQGQLESLLLDAGIHLETSTTVDDWDTAILFASMGLGCAVTPALHAEHLAQQHSIAIYPIESLPPVVFGWASRRWKSLPKVARDFIEMFAGNTSIAPHYLKKNSEVNR
ncbi:LysR family transcriptional regulator [Exilibacterium tricleocarpae]|uniref:LysR family transcriptional regulator n=1 Tax=Exilibacterium tricleocarpae TaxID=2591008 RepID=A0A545U5N2_9GAMM|nr:LysR family transcriptional regulator [Exilibacterium tricleocarpae]TQV84778.1 LysR family transcriptional regulator [Exilibacterium tricleocarpae]